MEVLTHMLRPAFSPSLHYHGTQGRSSQMHEKCSRECIHSRTISSSRVVAPKSGMKYEAFGPVERLRGSFDKVRRQKNFSALGIVSEIGSSRQLIRGKGTQAYAVTASRDIDPSVSQEFWAESDSFSAYSGYVARSSDGEVDLWDTYDAEKMSKYYWGKPILVTRRLLQIATTFGPWLFKRWLDSRSGKGDANFQERASELRAALLRMGPAFVKIAQAVSSRPDVIPPAYLQELSLLQDRIAPFATDLALDIIEDDLGVPVQSLFSHISPSPVAAASIGQVYQARLRPNGRQVAVKVQRPGVRAAIALDTFLLRLLAGYVRRIARLNTDLPAVVDEWATSLFREMDYVAEAENGLRFRRLFGSLPKVFIPEMFPELTSHRVLIMEWVEGERLQDVRDIELVEVGVYCSLSQLLDSGFYHADPHPGNLLRTPDGRLAYLDFGMMGEIKQDLREGLIVASVHLVNREFEQLAEDLIRLGLLPRNSQMDEMSQALTGVFEDAISRGVRNISFGDLSANLAQTMYRFKFRIPAYFSLVVRSLTVLEGIALKTDPSYKVLGSSYPWIARKVLSDPSPQLRSTLRALLYKDGSFRFDRLESLLLESTRPMFGVPGVPAGSPSQEGGGAANGVAGREQEEEKEEEEEEREKEREKLRRVLKFALSEQAEFVRETLLDEIAKGIDAFNRAAFDAASDAVERSLPLALAAAAPVPRLRLLEPEDAEHLDNLRRLSSMLARSPLAPSAPPTPSLNGLGQGGAGGRGPWEEDAEQAWGGGGVTWDEVSSVLVNAGSLVRKLPAMTVISELPLAAQRQAAMLPADLAARLLSRTIARTIRSTMAQRSPGDASRGITSSDP